MEKTIFVRYRDKANGIERISWFRKGKNMSENWENVVPQDKTMENLSTEESCECHKKATPRDEAEVKQLKNRLNRMAGQLNGIGKMLDENRYCGDILIQVAAVERALQSFASLVLQEHMETCVVEEIQKGNTAVVGEVVELIKKLI